MQKLQLTVYRERVLDKGEYKSHSGEDGKPYVGERMIMAADGLGGSAGIRHASFDRDLFDAEKLVQTLFQGIYADEELENEEFRNYVLNSFADFCEMGTALGDQYFKAPLTMKKGGYFGSRIVTAIVLHEVLFSKTLWTEGNTVWDKIHRAQTQAEWESVQKEIGSYFAQLIEKELKTVANKVNLIYESPMTGLALLGTTLCATLYNEGDGYVEGLYLEAGDSRPYVLDKYGMRQVIADQEGDDGAMSNCIKANEDAQFGILCEYHRFDTPCILFNVSDGCFDSSAFPSQLAFEKLILDCIVGKATDGTEELEADRAADQDLDKAIKESEMIRIEKQLEYFFRKYGRHDDSSTIAMKFFGFDTFEDIRAFAEARLAEIEETYLKGDPDVLAAGYVEEAIEAQKQRAFMEKRNGLWAQESVQNYCRELAEKSADFAQYAAECDGNIEKHSKEIDACCEKAIAPIKRYYLPILKKWGQKVDEKALEECNGIKNGIENELGEIRKKAEQYQAELEKARDAVNAALEKARTMNVDSGLEKDDQRGAIINLELKDIFQKQEAIQELLKSVDVEGKQSENIAKSLGKYFGLNQKAATSDEKAEGVAKKKGRAYDGMTPAILAESLVELEEIVGDKEVVFLEKDRNALLGLIDAIKAEKAAIDAIKTEREDKLAAATKKYWDSKFLSVIESIHAKNEPEVAVEDKQAIDDVYKTSEKEKEIAAKQAEIFVVYDKEYSREMNKDAATRFEETPKVQADEPEQESVEETQAQQDEAAEETQERVEESQEQIIEETQETAEETKESESEEIEETETVEPEETETVKTQAFETEPGDLAETATEEPKDEE